VQARSGAGRREIWEAAYQRFRRMVAECEIDLRVSGSLRYVGRNRRTE
jgi:hypothetical protein